MLDSILRILSIAGIILLILLCLALVLLLLVLFFPISYCISGQKSMEAYWVRARADWLFGILRMRFGYPHPGKIIVKLLWFTLYDSSIKMEDDAQTSDTGAIPQKKSDTEQKHSDTEPKQADTGTITFDAEPKQSNINTKPSEAEPAHHDTEPAHGKGISAKIEKIKYTIKGIYDKIKHIWENITFYKALLQDEETKLLWGHLGMRLKKIWKNIHPRKIKADIVFGTGSPDTTGYLLGIYGMLSPMLGKHVNITPDFVDTVFQGNFYISGYITVFQVLLHSLMFLIDKRLRLLINRVKNHTLMKG